MDNSLKLQDLNSAQAAVPTSTSGHVIIGQYFNNKNDTGGRVTVDWLTFWDRPLSEAERNLLH